MKNVTIAYKPNVTRFVSLSKRSYLRHWKPNENLYAVGDFSYSNLQTMNQPVCRVVYGHSIPSFLSFMVPCLTNYEGRSRQEKDQKGAKKKM